MALFDKADTDKNSVPPNSEVNLWSHRWIEAHKELSEWSVVEEAASALKDSHSMLESAWKSKNISKVNTLLHESPSITTSLECGEISVQLKEVYLTIHEGKLKEADDTIRNKMIQRCLNKFSLLPKVKPGIISVHQQNYREFQQLVELRESCQMMMESSTHSSRRSLPDVKNVLSAWRYRNPNLFEPVSVWEDLYSWRLHVFDTIASIFSWNEPATVSTLHDRSFASIFFGRAARKQGKKDVSLFLINDLTDCMSVPDAFLKLREQIVTYQYSADKDMLKGGLNLVNSTNLTFFDSKQKAEIFRLKSYFFNALNDKSNAHKSYCHTLQINPNYARGDIFA